MVVHTKGVIIKITAMAAEMSAGMGTLTFHETAVDDEVDTGADAEGVTAGEVGVSDATPDVISGTVAEVAPGDVAVAFALAVPFTAALEAGTLNELEDEDRTTRKKLPAIGLRSLVLRAKSETLKLNLDVDELANEGPIVSKSCG